jgi:DNA-binding NarL/FixJ family response regulator
LRLCRLTSRAEPRAASEGTVRNYLSETIDTLGACYRVEAARMARQGVA